MSNIPPSAPRRPDPIRDLPAASQAASSAQSEATIRDFLRSHFKGDIIRADKVCARVMESLSAKDKTGKNLSFDVVKKAILEAAEKDGKPLDPKDLKDLEELKPLFPKEEEIKKEDNPFKFIEEAKETIKTGKKKLEELKDKLETALSQEELNSTQKKIEELKEQIEKKLLEYKDTAGIDLKDFLETIKEVSDRVMEKLPNFKGKSEIAPPQPKLNIDPKKKV